MRSLIALLPSAALLLALTGCADRPGESAPLSTAAPDPAIRQQIGAFEAATDRIPLHIQSVLAPNGQPVYLFTAPCCDIWNRLYDAEGRFICAPTGGFTGAGDGKCPAWVFEQQRWQRPRIPGVVATAASAPASGP